MGFCPSLCLCRLHVYTVALLPAWTGPQVLFFYGLVLFLHFAVSSYQIWRWQYSKVSLRSRSATFSKLNTFFSQKVETLRSDVQFFSWSQSAEYDRSTGAAMPSSACRYRHSISAAQHNCLIPLNNRFGDLCNR